jgi:hypothetical protein
MRSSTWAPLRSHSTAMSRMMASAIFWRAPIGRPLGLPDWPGGQGRPRCTTWFIVVSLFSLFL